MWQRDPAPAWPREATQAFAALKAWRTAHPHATWVESEAAPVEQMAGLAARVQADMAIASDAADFRATATAGRPRCSAGGEPLMATGQVQRRLTTTRDRPVVVERSRGRGAACGAEFFPPG